MKKQIVAALLGVGFTITAILLTIVEQGPVFDGRGLKDVSPLAFGLMFVAVLLGNTMFAIDGFREAKEINAAALK